VTFRCSPATDLTLGVSNNTALTTSRPSLLPQNRTWTSLNRCAFILNASQSVWVTVSSPYQRHEVQPDVYCRRLNLQVPVAVSVKTGQIADVFHAICNVAMHPYVKELSTEAPGPSADAPRACSEILRFREALTEVCHRWRDYAHTLCFRHSWGVCPRDCWWRIEHFCDQGHLQGNG
jgi:hypothetical protein